MIPEQYQLKNTIKYPTSLLIGGLTKLGLEIADSLLEQGGYVIIIDNFSGENIKKLDSFPKGTLVSFLDYTSIPNLDEEIRRLDYVFYFGHESVDFTGKISTQQFLSFSNYLDATLALSAKFDAKFLLTTAIKAHQLVIANQELGLHLGTEGVKHTVYTNMEVQRYAESLAMEYVEKLNLDARIIRLGEIIGEGIDFGSNSPFVELILDAVEGDALRLKKDGLETEWLVHMLDAAYAIIKAQFSQNTIGKIFSVCYENPFTHLSIAYKIQEIEDGAKDIEFYQERDNLPSLRLYKPAANLTQIGWSPKVSLEKALKQSLAAAKIHILETRDSRNKDGKVVDKLKAFLDLAGEPKSKGLASEIGDSGPVSRLIAERKKQEELRKQSMAYASSAIKAKRKKKPRTFSEKFKMWSWDTVIALGRNINIFKNKTPTQVGIMGALIILGVFLYFFVFSPIIVLGRDFLLLVPEYNKLVSSLNNSNYAQAQSSAAILNSSLSNISTITKRYEGVANLLSLGIQYSELITLVDSYQLIAEGVENIGYSQEDFFKYVNEFKSNLQLRSGTESYLSVLDGGTDFSPLLDQSELKSPYLSLGIDKVIKGYDQLNTVDINNLPEFVAESLPEINQGLKEKVDQITKLKSALYLPEILGNTSTKNYVILVLDNTRPKPIGGDVAAFALLTLKNGSISDIVVRSPEDTSFDLSSIDSNILREINARRFEIKTLQNLRFSDIGTISDVEDYSEIVLNVFKSTYGKTFDGILLFNYNTLESLVKSLPSDKRVEVGGIDFSSGTLLDNLDRSQSSNATVKVKYDISAQILAQYFNFITSDLDNTLPELFETIDSEVQLGNINVYSPNMKYQDEIESQNLDGSQIELADFYIKPSISNEDLRLVNNDRYPSTSVTADLTITSELEMRYTMSLKFPNISTSQEVSVCLPLYVADSTITAELIPAARVVINTTNTQKCVVFKVQNETDVKLSWTSRNLTSNSSQEILNIDLGLARIKGSTMSSDYTIRLGSGLVLNNIQPFAQSTNGAILLTQNVNTDNFIKLTIEK